MSHFEKNCISVIIASLFLLLMAQYAFADNAEAPEPAYFDLPVTIDTIKVGISFGDTAADEVRLTCENSDGYSLGYFDYSRSFHELFMVEFPDIVLRPDTGFTLNSGEEDETVVGPWHLITDDVFDRFNDAHDAADGISDGFVGLIDGKFRVLVGSFLNSDDAELWLNGRDIQAQPFTGSEYSVLVTVPDTKQCVFIIDNGEKTKLALRKLSSDDAVSYCGNRYGGDFEVFRRGYKLTVVNYIGLEDYVKGVLPYEMIASWPMEALKAQGTCARTYVMNNIGSYFADGFDVRNDTYSQVYKGMTGTAESTDIAAEATKGEYVRYKGLLCRIYYMSSDGGATASSADVFAQRRAYLSGIIDDSEDDLDFYNKTWSSVLRESTVVRHFNENGAKLKNIKDLTAIRSDTGIVIKLEAADSKGNTGVLCGQDCFIELGLNSLNFEVTELPDDLWEFSGKGWGHNCGMSQWGAYAMARDLNADCAKIIDHYFTGAYIR